MNDDLQFALEAAEGVADGHTRHSLEACPDVVIDQIALRPDIDPGSVQLFDDELTCKDTDAEVSATGHIEGEDVLVVHAGSAARGDIRTSRFLDRGIVEEDKDRLRFLVAFPFKTAHNAASFILWGRQPAGPDAWTTSSAQTLRQLYEAKGLP